MSDIAKLNNVTYDNFQLLQVINPDQFDTNFSELVTKLDEVITLINKYNKTTDGNSGADNIASTTITNVTGNTVQSVLEYIASNYWHKTDTLTAPNIGIGSQSLVASEGQTVFTITNGAYTIGKKALYITVDGVLQPHDAYTETSTTSFTLSEGVVAGTKIFAFWFTNFNSTIASHADEHKRSGADSLNDYYERKINVDARDIGMIGDDIANDATALNTWISSLGTNKATLYLGVGTYKITTNVVFPETIEIKPTYGAVFKVYNTFNITINNYNSIKIGNQKIFDLSEGGSIIFTNRSKINAKWYGVIGDLNTDDTVACQNAINAIGTNGGVVYFPTGQYKITSKLTVPAGNDSNYSFLCIEGDGMYNTLFYNYSTNPSAFDSTFYITRGQFKMRGIGIVGVNGYRHHGIVLVGNVSGVPSRCYFDECMVVANGSAFVLSDCHSIWIDKCYGFHNTGGLVTAGWTHLSTDAYIYIVLGVGNFLNQLTVTNCVNEGYEYQVYTAQSGSGYGVSWNFENNQWEGSVNGLYIKLVSYINIKGNYLAEGSTGYTIELDNCRNIDIKPNYVHYQGNTDSKADCIKLNDCFNLNIQCDVSRIYLSGDCTNITAQNCNIYRIQDETSGNKMSLRDVTNTLISLPLNTINRQSGRAVWYKDTVDQISYPYGHRDGDTILKVNNVSGQSPGWVCTTASAVGLLTQTVGTGDDPTLVQEYYYTEAFDFRITITTGGITGVAKYKVEISAVGADTWVDLVTDVTTTELAHLIGGYFSIKWATGKTYVLNDVWTFTSTAPVYKEMANLA